MTPQLQRRVRSLSLRTTDEFDPSWASTLTLNKLCLRNVESVKALRHLVDRGLTLDLVNHLIIESVGEFFEWQDVPFLVELRTLEIYTPCKPIVFKRFPDSLHVIHLKGVVKLHARCLPPGLKCLSVDCLVALETDALPAELFSLVVSELFCPLTEPLSGLTLLPLALSELHIDSSSVHMFTGLPDTLVSLSLPDEFNESLENLLPSCLASLHLGDLFNHPLECLPSSLTILSLGIDFDQPIPPGALPPTLKCLMMGSLFGNDIGVGVLPDGLLHLTLPCLADGQLLEFPLEAVPKSIRVIDDLGAQIVTWRLDEGVLPDLSSLILTDSFSVSFAEARLPSSLRCLHLGSSYAERLTCLPNLTVLDMWFSDEWNYTIEPGTLPATLKVLRLPSSFKHRLTAGSLPGGLLHLELGEEYDLCLGPGVLPHRLEVMCLGDPLPTIEEGFLPSSLQVLGAAHHVILSWFDTHPEGVPGLEHLEVKSSFLVDTDPVFDCSSCPCLRERRCMFDCQSEVGTSETESEF
ncbi:MAG: uncharacterized protein KVP18_000910 [Porospora cf. gigantea A]|uniref:uncharacterized protein n=2 Tax=Porospora cf. gigantea A TaxID=2853593 RepID=UPI0035596561|nr:MAG: hypothetical protein KVP18_000910 [Porospora cf. gigantea A]